MQVCNRLEAVCWLLGGARGLNIDLYGGPTQRSRKQQKEQDKLKKRRTISNKNSLADVKSQASKATKNGHSSSNNSKRGQERSNRDLLKESSQRKRSSSLKNRHHRCQSREWMPKEQETNRRSHNRNSNSRSKSPPTSAETDASIQHVRFKEKNLEKHENQGGTFSTG